MKRFGNEESASPRIHQQGRDIDFSPTGQAFAIPEDIANMTQSEKRQITICNLFCNHFQSVADIMRVLDETYGNVVRVLLKRELTRDRRVRHASYPGPERRTIVPTTARMKR